MLEENQLSIVVLLIYAVFFAIMWLIALIPSVINSIGLARICNRVGAFKPVWCWVWALVFPPVAILRAGDIAAEREDPIGCRKHFDTGVMSVIVFSVLMLLAAGFGCMTAFSSQTPELSAINMMFALVMIVLLIVAIAVSVWMTVLLYISYFRIFKLYVPTWGAWLMLVGMFVLSQFAFLLLPVLSFLPFKQDEPCREQSA